jgi:hypothetical protein
MSTDPLRLCSCDTFFSLIIKSQLVVGMIVIKLSRCRGGFRSRDPLGALTRLAVAS